MNIYFAGSIRGGTDDFDIYVTLIDELKKYGDVFTEHIGREGLADLREELTPKDIYERDMAWLKNADLVIAEVTQPSLGVGYEVATAEALGKRILCLYRPLPDRHVSAIIAGNPDLDVRSYTNLTGAAEILRAFCTTELVQ